MTQLTRDALQQWASWLRLGRWLCASMLVGAVVAQPAVASYVLAPQYAGTFATGAGADAEFHQVRNDWHGSAVLWDEAAHLYGRGEPIGSFAWGTGLWGQADWLAVEQAAAGQPSAASGAIVRSFDGVLATINHANSRYLECYTGTWGPARLVPLFVPGASAPPAVDCSDADAGDPAQQNWTSHFSGFVRVADPGEYNFSVLNDDGFFFRLIGAGGAELNIGRDFLNPRDRIGFDDDLLLSPGLYGFELGSWNRLGAGVVDLRWVRDCTGNCDWQLVPTEHLVSAAQVPEPPLPALLAAAMIAAWWALAQPLTWVTRLRRPRWRIPGCSLAAR